eukprot:Hpha_TRINITY_DN34145_c0_g1::TRINITY_DN34145_c0_g1_i1::g.75961::m.75961/K05543/DUS2; tRNA-dihydrouridine synthase 2
MEGNNSSGAGTEPTTATVRERAEEEGVVPDAKRPRCTEDLGEAWCSDLRDKKVLAPMVRVGTLPFRLFSAKCGADVVYTEELIAQKVFKTERTVDEESGVVEYVLVEQHGKAKNRQVKRTVVFATPVRESRSLRPEGAHVVLQLGANEAEPALRAARHVERDVDGIDLNMGCPKAFSVKGGMGAALLTQPEKVKRILTALVEGLSVPVSCKIRLLPERADTLRLLEVIRDSGVRCLTIHARYPPQRSSEPPHYDDLRETLAALDPPLRCPVMLSGDVWEAGGTPECTAQLAKTGDGVCLSAMVARGALQHPGIFAVKDKRLGKLEAHRELLRYNLRHGGCFHNAKYVLTRSFQEIKEFVPLHEACVKAKDMKGLWEALGMEGSEFDELNKAWKNPLRLMQQEGEKQPASTT